MKLNKLLHLLFAFVLLLGVASCSTDSSDELQPRIDYANGFLIANEGKYGTPNAEVTFVTSDLSLKQDNIFSFNNGGKLGDVLQMIAFNGNNAYLLLNNSNKIQIVNRYNFKAAGEITSGLNQPRYMAFANNNIYVTNDKYQGDKFVSVYKVSDNSLIKKIPFSDTVERIVEAGNNIFVQNASFGYGNNITLINTTTNEIQKTFSVNGNINKIISNNQNVYAIAAGTTDSYIYQISSTGDIIKTITLTGIADAKNLEISNNKFYFSSGKSVYTMDMKLGTVPTSPLFTVASSSDPYSDLYGFSVVKDLIFTSDANGFKQDSKIVVYNTSGDIIKTFSAGIASNSVYWN
ncbi:DUF5074 domain-containing protein [Chryseobacterium bernardetii]|uniref:YncE family protein n=1 Tax=Chryseobacterium bernardetii TaxID=1241978 RepID=A0A3G6THD9_9FLAO|nr:DUF5074 domain-containing protein [Chryseobacterium bernardetii]AZB27353.1 hypothetical protein EG339_23575 [Chryseobacterium bernardetii]AZB33757.1 hypothetical protein EG351_09125 [Chryseobacterium bernardetii]